MATRGWYVLLLAAIVFVPSSLISPAPACCPAPPRGKPVINADQTVILLWDADNKTEHFIRKASFKSEADDFGFLVPSPSQPELSESGNEAFPYLGKLTEPEIKKVKASGGGIGCGCAAAAPKSAALAERSNGKAEPPGVTVLQEKLVAGFHAVVLEAQSANDLVAWLKEHNYAFSPEIEAWAKPYVEKGWKITALKVAKTKDSKDKDAANAKDVAASSLRISFKTDRPLFPYREPDYKNQVSNLGAKSRLLRIYFLGEARYQGELTKDHPWTGNVAWANPLKPEDRKHLLESLKLPETTGPAEMWLTEFEDNWPYQVAPADVYFSKSDDQGNVKRPPIIQYVQSKMPGDVALFAIVGFLLVPPLVRRVRVRMKE